MAQATIKLNAQHVVKDIRGGCDDAGLMAKYGLSPAQLDKLFKTLIDRGLVKPSELAARTKAPSKQDLIQLEANNPAEPKDPAGSKDTLTDAKVGGEKTIRSHLAFAIFCIVWFFPLGIVALVHASRVKPKLQMGDYEGALASSKAAKRWCWITVLGTGVPIVAILASFIVLASVSPVSAPFIYSLF